MLLQVPIDIQQLTQFRVLSDGLKDAGVAAEQVFLRLWVELAYQAKAGAPVGLLSNRAASSFRDGFGPHGQKVFSALTAETCFLQQDSEGWWCSLFEQHHEHLSQGYVKPERQAALQGGYLRRLKVIARDAQNQSLLIPEENFRRPDGTPMTAEERNDVTVLVRSLDLALGLPERPASDAGFPATLLLAAFTVYNRWTADQLSQVGRQLHRHRKAEGIPSTTEQVLVSFEQVARRLAELDRPSGRRASVPGQLVLG